MTKRFHPLLIIFLLAAFLCFSAWSAYRASTQVSQITDRDYYSKGLKYNTTLVEKRAASVLGWQLAASLSGHRLQIRLSNGKQGPVTGAVGRLVFYQQSEAEEISLPLKETAAGNYSAELPRQLTGEITARIDFERDGARINRQLLLNI